LLGPVLVKDRCSQDEGQLLVRLYGLQGEKWNGRSVMNMNLEYMEEKGLTWRVTTRPTFGTHRYGRARASVAHLSIPLGAKLIRVFGDRAAQVVPLATVRFSFAGGRERDGRRLKSSLSWICIMARRAGAELRHAEVVWSACHNRCCH
jgi:hypothetical protein